MQRLIRQIARFEQLLDSDAALETVLPSLCRTYPVRYAGYTLRQLCQEMHDLFVKHNVKQRQKEMFRRGCFPAVRMSPKAAHTEFVRGNTERVAVSDIAGRIAAEGALPYPPGVLCVVRGSLGSPGSALFPRAGRDCRPLSGLRTGIAGAYIEQDDSGHQRVYACVIRHQQGEGQ